MPDYSGPWSFFRLLEDLRSRGAVQPANGGGYDLTLQSSRGAGDLARVRVVPDRDPFAALDMLRRFGC
jgi:type VI protein secretion system component VasK